MSYKYKIGDRVSFVEQNKDVYNRYRGAGVVREIDKENDIIKWYNERLKGVLYSPPKQLRLINGQLLFDFMYER